MANEWTLMFINYGSVKNNIRGKTNHSKYKWKQKSIYQTLLKQNCIYNIWDIHKRLKL